MRDGEADVKIYRGMVWHLCVARKGTKKCCRCEERLIAGVTQARPITNGYHRMDRLCHYCFHQLMTVN